MLPQTATWLESATSVGIRHKGGDEESPPKKSSKSQLRRERPAQTVSRREEVEHHVRNPPISVGIDDEGVAVELHEGLQGVSWPSSVCRKKEKGSRRRNGKAWRILKDNQINQRSKATGHAR